MNPAEFVVRFSKLAERCEEIELEEDEKALATNVLPEDWYPGSSCPQDGKPCERLRCFDSGVCPTRRCGTSNTAAEAGRLLVVLADAAGDEDRCLTCAFRSGTRANRTTDVMTSLESCFAGRQRFDCHERPEMCAGWRASMRYLGFEVAE